MHGTDTPPSDWVRRWAHLVPSRTAHAKVLDLACGRGRHTRWLARQGCHVTAVDRDADALATLADLAPLVTPLAADLEGQPWPLAGRVFDAVVVTNYLWRPLWPHILDSVAPGGLLLCETFAHGNATVGRPARPDFLLQPGELLQVCQGLHVIAYEDGFLNHPERFVQRVVAWRPDGTPNPRHTLHAAG